MAKPPKAFDVWFVAANTVYKAVPYTVIADWTQGGRLAAGDKVRPAGTTVAWVTVGEHEYLADYLPRAATAKVVPATPVAASPATTGEASGAGPPTGEAVELPDVEPPERRKVVEEDDEVDMIPLIDVSLVLLVFFILMRAAGALAPVDVPEMKYAGQLNNDPEAITIIVEADPKDPNSVTYSVRVGAASPKLKHDQLQTPEEAIKALDELLSDAQRPPDVRIACQKSLPRERVYELRRELDGRQKKNYINSFTATVVEAPKKD